MYQISGCITVLGYLASRHGPPLISELCSIHEFDNILRLKFDPDKYKTCELTNNEDIFSYEYLFVRRYTVHVNQEIPHPWPGPRLVADTAAYIFVAALTPDDLPPDTPSYAEQVIQTGNKIGIAMCDEMKIHYVVARDAYETGVRISSYN